MNTPIKIRAHHFLCMQGFQGYGYDDNFTNHLCSVIEQLKAKPNTSVQVVAECDEICVGCPNRIDNQCQTSTDSNHNIKNMDLKILTLTEIKPDDIIEVSQMIARVNYTFKTRAQLEDICGDCQWTEKCTWVLSLDSGNCDPAVKFS